MLKQQNATPSGQKATVRSNQETEDQRGAMLPTDIDFLHICSIPAAMLSADLDFFCISSIIIYNKEIESTITTTIGFITKKRTNTLDNGSYFGHFVSNSELIGH